MWRRSGLGCCHSTQGVQVGLFPSWQNQAATRELEVLLRAPHCKKETGMLGCVQRWEWSWEGSRA